MRISDWSSDVCSSDLGDGGDGAGEIVRDGKDVAGKAGRCIGGGIRLLALQPATDVFRLGGGAQQPVLQFGDLGVALGEKRVRALRLGGAGSLGDIFVQFFVLLKIGRASCRERVCQYV